MHNKTLSVRWIFYINFRLGFTLNNLFLKKEIYIISLLSVSKIFYVDSRHVLKKLKSSSCYWKFQT